MKIVLAGLLCAAFIAPNAYADLLCVKTKTKANKKTGAVALGTSFKTVAAGQACPIGYTQIVDTSVFKGPKGDTGPQGPAGQVDLDSCVEEVTTYGTCADGDVCQTDIKCGGPGTKNGSELNDYMIAWDWTNSTATPSGNAGAYLTEAGIEYAPNTNYPTGMWIKTTSEDGFGTHNPALRIICCIP